MAKIPFVDAKLLYKVEEIKKSGADKAIKTWSRRSTILPNFIGLTFLVYDGKKFVPVQVNERLVNHKLGEFVPTRISARHSGNKKAVRS